MIDHLDQMKADEKLLRLELEACGVKFRGNVRTFKCPFHDDHTPSASIHLHDGHWLVKCFTCHFSGTFLDVRAWRNKSTPAEELRKMNDAAAAPVRREPPPRIYPTIEAVSGHFQKHEATYIYADPITGKPELIIVRWWCDAENKKKFSQFRPSPGGYINKGIEAPWPLYNRARIATATRICLVEGEKCVHALHNVGIIATTAPGGGNTQNVAKINFAPLAGKDVYIWPDADEPSEANPLGKGIEFMRECRRQLEALTPRPRLFWVDPAPLGLGDGGDAADLVSHFLEPEERRTAVEEVLAEAKALGVSGQMDEHYEAIIAGKMHSLSFGPWHMLTKMTNALLPGTVTMICGDPGSTKSFILLEAAQAWHEFGIKWCIFQLEEDREFHMKRAVAQRIGDSRLTDHGWIFSNAEKARQMRARERAWEDDFGPNMADAPTQDINLDTLAEWIESKAKVGFEVICADPITAVDSGKEPWVAERKFLLRVKRAARTHSTRIILVTHPVKETKRGFGMGSMAGSTNYARFTQTVIWVERCQELEDVRVNSGHGGAQFLRCNRKIHLVKTRNSMGAGYSLAFHFDGATFRSSELGIILPDDK